jgi:hypothetical protein
MLRLFLTVVLLATCSVEARPRAGSDRPRSSGDKKADFLFRALDRNRDHELTRRELSVLLDPKAFRPRMLRQVRRKMGLFGKLPGMQGFLDTFGREPPFGKNNHRLWVREFDRNDDGILESGERALAAGAILGRRDRDGDGVLDRLEFSAMLVERRQLVAASPDG